MLKYRSSSCHPIQLADELMVSSRHGWKLVAICPSPTKPNEIQWVMSKEEKENPDAPAA